MTHSVESVMQQICEKAAQAVARYAQVSGIEGESLPESFIQSFVFDQLGSKITMTLESNAKLLCEWDTNARKRQKLPAVEEKLRKLGGRIDLVVFDGSSPEKNREKFLVMVEFKKWHLRLAEGDRKKLLDVLDDIKTCPYGAICFLFDALPADQSTQNQKAIAESINDLWFCARVPRRKFTICARLFPRR